MRHYIGITISGAGAGALNGLFGAGGGMVLVPLMGKLTDINEKSLFSSAVAILLPICIVSLIFADGWASFSFMQALPYLTGSLLGGIGAGIGGKRIPVLWLHRVLGILILWGGIRYLW